MAAQLPLRVSRLSFYAISSRLSASSSISPFCATLAKDSSARQRRPYAIGRTSNITDWRQELDLLKHYGKAAVQAEDLFTPEYFKHDVTEYYQCMEKFANVSPNRDNYRWVHSLEATERPSVQLIHETACFLHLLEGAEDALKATPRVVRWALPLWASASELDYEPSTLSLFEFLQNPRYADQKSLFKPIEARFRKLVAADKNPYALILGIRYPSLRAKPMPENVIRVCERALQLGGEDFTWKEWAYMLQAISYEKLGKENAALRFYRLAAVVPSFPRCDKAIGLLSNDIEESRKHMYKAACREPKLFSHFAEMELERSINLTDPKDKEESHKLATEWSRLADPFAAY